MKKDSFTTLARAIAGQQISVKAADAVWQRVVLAVGGKPAKISPDAVLELQPAVLRLCGLSERKVQYIRHLAERFVCGDISGARLARLADDEVRRELTELKGIGPWTADMYLIFNLWRPNVLPLGDVGLIRAIEQNYCRGRNVSQRKLRELQQLWQPYATVAVWYLWRSLDPYPVEY
jgi:DNA-3-methyladenine glycosylase II